MGTDPTVLTHRQRSIDNEGVLRAGEIAFPREEHTKWLSNSKGSALTMYVEVTLYRLNGLYVYTHTHTCCSLFFYSVLVIDYTLLHSP